MRIIVTITILISNLTVMFSQDFTFFDEGFKENDKLYSYALVQPEIDSTYILEKVEKKIFKAIDFKTKDTIFFKDFRILKSDVDFNLISSFTDTSHLIVKVKESSTFLLKEACNDNVELVIESVPKFEGLSEWKCTNLKQSVNRKNWILEENEESRPTYRYIPIRICDHTEVKIPAEFRNIVIALPSKKLNDSQRKLFQRKTTNHLCINGIKKENIEFKSNAFFIRRKEYYIRSQADIIKIEILSKDNLEKRLPQITQSLILKKILATELKNDINAIRQAIVQYQINCSLPIGQFDIECINKLLKENGS